ncbi:MAG: SO_0444 family Cu/Zn efflux transporter [Bacteroidales bacterium]|nr:SO_0444 family Cu/Zn efflux transporter [Bacteroidales bacterium]
MTIQEFLNALLAVLNAMSPYLLLGFLIAGVLHVFVPKRFYARYLSRNNKLSVLWAALLGVPLPLCSCGVIPTAVGLKNEGASKGAVASFLIATPQTGIDSILATFSLMGLGFAIMRPVAALVTGVCGGLLVNRYDCVNASMCECVSADASNTQTIKHSNNQAFLSRFWRVLKYAYYDMIQDIGLRLAIGLLVAALINVVVPDEFFLSFGKQPLLQMLVILVVAVPMYICSTGSIPVAAALMMKGLSPGAALVMLMAGPAVNIASILVVRKSMGSRFTWIYLLTIVGFSVLFGLLINALGIKAIGMTEGCGMHSACCAAENASPSVFQIICSSLLVLFIIIALSMKLFSKFKKHKVNPDSEIAADTVVYTVEGMHCNHCKAACEQSVGKVTGVTSCEATPAANTLVVTGKADDDDVRKAVEQAGFEFKGVKVNG